MMDDLYCLESDVENDDLLDQSYTGRGYEKRPYYVRTAKKDPTFLTDRCFENLLKSETAPQMTGYAAKEITEDMRRIVATWMLELCEQRKCQEEVFILALNYMDRHLRRKVVPKTSLQLLASACLLLASKLREPSCKSLSADVLVYFTDDSITKYELINWELLVLNTLKWDISVVTPLDFLEHILTRLNIKNSMNIRVDKVREHAQTFISMAAQENFCEFLPSTIAAASVVVSVNGLKRDMVHECYLIRELVDRILKGSITEEVLNKCMARMERVYQEQKKLLSPEYYYHTPPNSPCIKSQGVPGTPQKCKAESNGTPVDIQDINF
ncbi:G1/S-specific cyclin-D2 [Phlebotomus argentipes]|uniref:G1/S-specific cyclin-D2 n=1 Tax=Phlebotomus argentipes TaxID=94469 RepID=UPI002892B483|nr:G1/S-specific cyclin-D2 [Phlebotomus argentipes]